MNEPIDGTQPTSSVQWNYVSTAVGTVILMIGYIMSILDATARTIPGFLAITAATMIDLILVWQVDALIRQTSKLFFTVLVGTVTLFSIICSFLGVGFDWLLPMVTVSLYTLIWNLRQALITSGILLVAVLGIMELIWGRSINMISAGLQVGAGFIFVIGFTYIVTLYQQEQTRTSVLVAQLQNAHNELQEYAKRVELLTEIQVRNEMAREIHDTLGHYLTILAVQLETLLRLTEHSDAALHQELQESRRIAGECLTEVRSAVRMLRSTTPVNRSLTEIVDEIAQTFHSSHPDVEIVQDIEEDRHLELDLQHVLQRCLQEAFTNIHKHAHASKVLIRGRVNSANVEVSIIDNGVGKQIGKAVQEGFGLLGMQERVALYSGICEIGPGTEQGWRIDLVIPLLPQKINEVRI